MLKKLALAAVAAGALAAVRKRVGGKAEADLWHEATRGPQARQHAHRPLTPAAGSRHLRGRSSIGRAPPLQGGG